MGKQVRGGGGSSSSGSKKQRRHNSATRGARTKKLGPLWAIRQYKEKDEEGKERIKTYDIRVPIGVAWDSDLISKKSKELGLPEPYDSLHLDWADELREYVDEHSVTGKYGSKIEREPLDNGRYEYKVIKVFTDKTKKDELLLTIESPFNHNFVSTGKFKKKSRA